MASTVAGLAIPAATTTFAAAAAGTGVLPRRNRVWFPTMAAAAARRGGGFAVRSSGPATPSDISDKLSESIKEAEETCAAEEKGTAECASAWDTVEEISAAASHARDNLKESNDPLEQYCKENPESDECRVYDN